MLLRNHLLRPEVICIKNNCKARCCILFLCFIQFLTSLQNFPCIFSLIDSNRVYEVRHDNSGKYFQKLVPKSTAMFRTSDSEVSGAEGTRVEHRLKCRQCNSYHLNHIGHFQLKHNQCLFANDKSQKSKGQAYFQKQNHFLHLHSKCYATLRAH